ncbi:SDR family oxidoreductase [Mycobacterium syngnathidarum]
MAEVCPRFTTRPFRLVPSTGARSYRRTSQLSAAFALSSSLRRYGNPAEVAYMIVALLAPEASYITGAVIPVDGGLTARNG